LREGGSVLADKGYDSLENRKIVEEEFKAKDFIMRKKIRNKKMSEKEKERNKKISRTRYKVERAFASLKKHLGFDRLRYLGKKKAQMELFLVSMCYNLKKAVNLSFC